MRASRTCSGSMNDTEQQVLDTIKNMEKEREEAHRTPSHILYRALAGRVRCDEATLRKALNSLFAQNLIVVGDTLNDKYIHAK